MMCDVMEPHSLVIYERLLVAPRGSKEQKLAKNGSEGHCVAERKEQAL